MWDMAGASTWSIIRSQGTQPAAPVGGGVGFGGETPLVQVTKKPQTFVGAGAPRTRGSPKSRTLPAPAEQSLLSLLFK